MADSPANEIPSTGNPAAPAARARAWWQTDWFFIACTIVVTLGLAYAMSVWEVVSRAKHAYLEGAKYEQWMNDPAAKKAALDAELASKKITQEDYNRMMQDSDLKNAVVWYETATDLFQPPESRWVVESRDRLKVLKPEYQAWLKSLGVDPVDDSPHPDNSFHW